VQSDSVDRKVKGASATHKPGVIAGEGDGLPLVPEKIHRRQMKRVESSHWLWEGLQRSCQYRWGELDKGDTVQQRAHFVGMERVSLSAWMCVQILYSRRRLESRVSCQSFSATDLRQEDEPARPKYRDRSTVAPVLSQLLLELAE